MSTYTKIEIVPYNPDWPNWFQEIKELLAKTLGDLAISIDHIGSTAVPGLGSKNRIDVQVTLSEISENHKNRIDEALKKAGFKETELSRDHRPLGDNSSDEEWKKLFLSCEKAPFSFDANIHFRAKGKANQAYSLLFRDYLRVHPEIAAAYQLTKENIARFHPHNIDAYVDIKDPVCDIIIHVAKEWVSK